MSTTVALTRGLSGIEGWCEPGRLCGVLIRSYPMPCLAVTGSQRPTGQERGDSRLQAHAQRMRLCRAETPGLYNRALRLISILSEAAWHSTLDPHAAHVVQTCHDSSIILPGQKVFRRQTGPQYKTPCVGMHLPSHAAASPTRTGAWPCALLQGCTFPAFQDYSTRWLCNTIWNRLCIM
jgi:hypothetical protein